MVLLMAFLRGSTDGLGVLQHVHVSSSAYYFVILCMRGDAGRPSFASTNFIMHERIPLGRIRVLPSSPHAQSTARVVRLPEIDVRVVYIHMGGGSSHTQNAVTCQAQIAVKLDVALSSQACIPLQRRWRARFHGYP